MDGSYLAYTAWCSIRSHVAQAEGLSMCQHPEERTTGDPGCSRVSKKSYQHEGMSFRLNSFVVAGRVCKRWSRPVHRAKWLIIRNQYMPMKVVTTTTVKRLPGHALSPHGAPTRRVVPRAGNDDAIAETLKQLLVQVVETRNIVQDLANIVQDQAIDLKQLSSTVGQLSRPRSS